MSGSFLNAGLKAAVGDKTAIKSIFLPALAQAMRLHRHRMNRLARGFIPRPLVVAVDHESL